MKRSLAVLATCLTLAGTLAGVGTAGAHSSLGTPGDANCVGQTTAYLAQLAKNSDVEGFRGIGGLARAFDGSVQDLKQAIQEFCAGP